jgi:hypothetical protein
MKDLPVKDLSTPPDRPVTWTFQHGNRVVQVEARTFFAAKAEAAKELGAEPGQLFFKREP